LAATADAAARAAARAVRAPASQGSRGAAGGGFGARDTRKPAHRDYRWFGRADISNAAQPRFSWSGTGFVARFSGTGLTARLNNGGAFIFKAVVDGTPKAAFTTTTGTANYDLATGLSAGTHTVELYRQTEAGQGNSQLVS